MWPLFALHCRDSQRDKLLQRKLIRPWCSAMEPGLDLAELGGAE